YGSNFSDPSGLSEALKIVGANCLAISQVLYFISGFAVLFYFFKVYQIGRPNRIGLSILGVFFYQILVWVGIVDVWFDFRAPGKPKSVRSNQDENDSFFDI
ncbi:DUF2232 domain-containing protein, partial [bacterium]|nr:DUF2232 domain-containing protein [bacterium]